MKIKSVYHWQNDMVMVFDEKGQQIPELQGKYTKELWDKIMKLCNKETIIRENAIWGR